MAHALISKIITRKRKGHETKKGRDREALVGMAFVFIIKLILEWDGVVQITGVFVLRVFSLLVLGTDLIRILPNNQAQWRSSMYLTHTSKYPTFY